MSTNPTVAQPSLSSELGLITVIRPVLRSLMIAHTFLILLVPLLFALFHYSTPHTRRRPIFILNVVTLLMAVTLGTIVDVAGISTILVPLKALPATVYVAIGAFSIFQSVLVDLILLMRLVVVYPLSQVGPKQFALVTSLPVLLKIARLINVSIFLKVSVDMLDNPNSATNDYSAYFSSPYLKAEWTAQIVDNAYASIMFLRSIRGRGAHECFCSSFITVQSMLTHRLRILFRIAVSNFVIPTLFSIVLLVISFYDVNGDYVGDIVYVNNMVSAFGIVFATVWVGMDGRRKELRQSLDVEFCNVKNNNAPNSATGPLSVSTGVVATVNADCQSPEEAKQDPMGIYLEIRHEMALGPFANQQD